MPRSTEATETTRLRTCATTAAQSDLFGASPGVNEMAGRFADSLRPDGSDARLRERALAGGLECLDDTQALALILSRSVISGAPALAAALMGRFGCLRRVLTADQAKLSAIVGALSAIDLRLIYDATRRLAAAELPGRSLVSCWADLVAYLKLTMAHCEREAFRVLFLDNRNQLIVDEILNHGTTNHAPVYPREVVRRALELSASSLILVHNHPSGDPTPSKADIEITRRTTAAANTLDISVFDHVIVGHATITSFKALGLI